MLPEQNSLKSLVCFHRAMADQIIWSTLIHNSWERNVKYNDFSNVATLRAIAGRGKGLLLLSMHYGPVFYGYSLSKMGLNPAILALKNNIPDIGGIPLQRLLANEYTFLGTYDGMVTAKRSEKLFTKMMMNGRPGMIMIDGMAKKNYIPTNCLGVDYHVGVFPFKLALTHSFPTAVIWFSKIKGKGYKLNVREICFDTVEEGVNQYAAFLDKVVRTDPYRWHLWRNVYEIFSTRPSAKNRPN
jgi:lauroyl/myristoyl acyltransferase